jgi:hypothetical protein
LDATKFESKAGMENTSHCIGVATYYLPTDIKFHMSLLLLAGGKEQCPMREILTIFSHFVRKRATTYKRESTVLDATKFKSKAGMENASHCIRVLVGVATYYLRTHRY